MTKKTLIAVFAGESLALEAKAALLGNGCNEDSMVISIGLTNDAIAAEAPGQAYENQPNAFNSKG